MLQIFITLFKLRLGCGSPDPPGGHRDPNLASTVAERCHFLFGQTVKQRYARKWHRNIVKKKSWPFLPTYPIVSDELLHVDASKRLSSISYSPFDPVEGIYGESHHGNERNHFIFTDFHMFIWFRIIFVSFARLLNSWDVIFVTPRLITSNNA